MTALGIGLGVMFLWLALTSMVFANKHKKWAREAEDKQLKELHQAAAHIQEGNLRIVWIWMMVALIGIGVMLWVR